MSISFRPYRPEPRYGPDYTLLRRFYLELDDINYPFGRWDWMISHSYLEVEGLDKIGMWFDGARLVGVATYDLMLDGKCFFALKNGYQPLYGEMIEYAQKALTGGHRPQLLIRDGNAPLQTAARKLGYTPTQMREHDAVFDIGPGQPPYTLPKGFSITSMEETYDLAQYGRVLWKGFNHELNGEGPFAPGPEALAALKAEFERPNVNLALKIAVVSPGGEFVSYCGMWQDAASENALVEPVATDPAYRKMGLGRAAVLEAIARCGWLGAKKALVGSSQQFYYNLGFRPAISSTIWERGQ